MISSMLSILKNHSIDENKSYVGMFMASKPGYPGGEIPALTLVVETSQGLKTTSGWAAARDELQKIFSTNGFEDMKVEIYD